jgi:hypothetical protein
MAFTCGEFQIFLLDRNPHYDDDILTDWFPIDSAYVGQFLTGTWDAGTGETHTYDRVHVAMPDESGCWEPTDRTGCNNPVTGALPCAPAETCVGWGMTRNTYTRERKSYSTLPLCFDQINTKPKAKQLFGQIIGGLKKMTGEIRSNWMRTWHLRGVDTLHICGSSKIEVTMSDAVFGVDPNNCNRLDLGSADNLPTSRLTVQYLNTFYEPLQLEGYFNTKYMPSGMFKLITDALSAQELREGNPALMANFRFTDFLKGGQMFKFGLVTAVGNFGITYDNFPMRFVHLGAGVLQRVFPYTNVAATTGLKRQVAQEYLTAPYQASTITHPESMRVLTSELRSVHSEMPFLVRDLGGKWRFTGPQSDVLMFTANGTTCTVDNKRRNQGLWWADFEGAVRYERPELVRQILHLREPGCMANNPRCSAEPDYVVQDNSSCPDMCID